MQWAVCVQLISNAAVSCFQSALNSGTVKNVTSVRSGKRVIKCALVSLDLECQAHDALPFALSLLLVVSCRQSGSFHSSQSQSMTEGQAEVMIGRRKVRAKVRFSSALLLTTDILMHAADKGAGAAQMLRMKSNSVARSCPRETLANGFRWHCSREHQVAATPYKLVKNVFGDLATDRHTAFLPFLNASSALAKWLCVGSIQEPKMFKNRDLISRSQGPLGCKLSS